MKIGENYKSYSLGEWGVLGIILIVGLIGYSSVLETMLLYIYGGILVCFMKLLDIGRLMAQRYNRQERNEERMIELMETRSKDNVLKG